MNAIARPSVMQRADARLRFSRVAEQRLRWLMLAALGVAAIFILRIGQIAAGSLFSDAQARSPAVGGRADIIDRNGVPLARTITVSSIRVSKPRLMGSPQLRARQLAAIFPDTSEAEFLRRLTMRASDFLDTGASGAQVAQVEPLLARYRRDRDADAFAAAMASAFPTRDEAAWKRRILSKSGAVIRHRATLAQLNAVNELADIAFEYPREQDRLYPQGPMAAHLLGFVTPGRGGAMGIERSFERQLANASGAPVQLALDARVQAALDLELSDAVTKLQAQGGAGVVLDVSNGEVVAMASYPTFDPNDVHFPTAEAQWNGVTYTTYELGSTFKPITVAAAMDAGVVTDLAKRYDATRPVSVGGHQIRDSHSMGRWINVPETLIHSSNVVTAQIADKLGAERLQATFRALDFDKRPSVEINERGRPMWASPWGRATTMTAGFGHSIQVTPLHLASAYAALANGGIYHPPTLLKRPAGPVPGRRVFTEQTSARMRQLLRLIVSDGTGSRADAPGYLVGGKTGSAERAVGGRYVGNSVVATFAGVFPMNRPRYVVLVMIDRPPGNEYSLGQRTAGFTAAPVVRKVVERIGPLVGIFPDTRRDLDLSDLTPLLWRPRAQASGASAR